MALTRINFGQINTTTREAEIVDPILLLNKNQTGDNTEDSGLIIERGDETNVGIIWDESEGTFALITTADTGSTAGNVVIGAYANLKVQDVYAGGDVTVVGNLTVNGSTLTINSTNVSIDDLNLTLAAGAANATVANGAGITVDGANASITYLASENSWQSNIPVTVSGNVTATNFVGNLTGAAATAATVTANAQPNITSVGTLSSLTITGNLSAGNLSGVINANVDTLNASNLTASSSLQVTSSTISTGTTSGAAVITGGMGVGGNIYLGGQLSAQGMISGSSVMANTATFTGTGAITLTAGNTSQRPGSPVEGMIRFNSETDVVEFYDGADWAEVGSGSAGIPGGSDTQIQYNNAGTFGGVSTMTFDGNIVTVSNLAISTLANITATTASTNTTTGALKVAGGVGVAGNIYAGGQVNITGILSAGNISTAGTVSATGNISGGNISGATITGNVVSSGTSEFSTLNSNTLVNVTATTASTSTTTGAIQVAGGVGVSGNVYANAFYGAATGLTSIPGANITGTVANATYATSAGTAGTAGTVTTNAQPNITSVGTLDSLTVTGNISAATANFTGNTAVTLTVGNTSQRPTPATGMIRFNSETVEFEGYDGSIWSGIGGGGEFVLSGSCGTIYSSEAGTGGTGNNNFFAGYCAGACNTTGCNNFFGGFLAGRSNTTGCNNTFFGQCAGYSNTTGNNNTFIGGCAGRANTTGYSNIFFGFWAGCSNTTGGYNTFFGGFAGYANTTGGYNTFFGSFAGYANTTGCNNTFIGQCAGFSNTTGRDNTFIGQCAGFSNTTGRWNTFFGRRAGACNTTGNNNTFIGFWAGCSNTTGCNNTFFGFQAGSLNTSGSDNTFIGYYAGYANTTGNFNNFFGCCAGRCNTTGSNNIFIGCFSGSSVVSGSNNTIIGSIFGTSNLTNTAIIAAGTCERLRVDDTGLYVNGTLFEGGGSVSWIKKTATYTAAAGDHIIADTTAGTFTINLPATPAEGDSVTFADGAAWATNALTVGRNGSTIEGSAEDLNLDISGIQVNFIYDGATWEVFAFTGPSSVVVSDDTATNATVYPVWATTSTGTQPLKASSSKLYFNPSTGVFNATDFNSLSDANKKTNVVEVTNPLEKLESLRGVYYNWKETGARGLGLIAQEVERVIPEVVSTNHAGEKSIAYGNLVGLLVEALKKQQLEIRELYKMIGEVNGQSK